MADWISIVFSILAGVAVTYVYFVYLNGRNVSIPRGDDTTRDAHPRPIDAIPSEITATSGATSTSGAAHSKKRKKKASTGVDKDSATTAAGHDDQLTVLKNVRGYVAHHHHHSQMPMVDGAPAPSDRRVDIDHISANEIKRQEEALAEFNRKREGGADQLKNMLGVAGNMTEDDSSFVSVGKASELNALKEKVKKLEGSMHAKDNIISGLNQKNAQLNQEKGKFDAERKKLIASVQDVQKENVMLNDEVVRLQKEDKALRVMVKNIQDQVMDEKEQMMIQYNAQRVEMEATSAHGFMRVQKQLQDALQRHEIDRRKLQDTERQYDKLKQNQQMLLVNVREMETEIIRLRGATVQYQTELDQLRRWSSDMMAVKQQSDRDKGTLQSMLDIRNKEVETLRAELQSVKRSSRESERVKIDQQSAADSQNQQPMGSKSENTQDAVVETAV